ncbi:hypothetical protein TNCV_1880581 [Trichonephila clavipes]|nr:hypothetical protein TNCV_1880581 [Trichonephila clavipes]
MGRKPVGSNWHSFFRKEGLGRLPANSNPPSGETGQRMSTCQLFRFIHQGKVRSRDDDFYNGWKKSKEANAFKAAAKIH